MTEPTILQTIAFRVPGRPPSANSRRNWHKVAEDNETWKDAALVIAANQCRLWEGRHGLRWRALKRCHVTVTFGLHTKARHDPDNLISSIKPLLDGIVAAGILLDDSIEVIDTIMFGWRLSPRDPFTEFMIEEVAE